ncbi:ArfGap-domain-containing protein [Stemphylium lycopersici]|uniref:ArfGap-domain-containing protein n=1 Tax=Stemphylium lycopersici TaxID=183478 RepID=A0A364NCU8_STELY|nr:hypothetical protein TW65_00615 [Stemphylium lycopersici]RAR06202.1 ArfGap-domain-containing protein [Stemphylium lycopersici]RAR14921.1 ArfGap-domain-containing protein [Stemphylium lycopersici]
MASLPSSALILYRGSPASVLRMPWRSSGLLLAGYSQLKCGLSAYHWQVMVFIAWFGSFSFVSAMSFLAGSPQMKNGMRYIRLGFMVLLGSLLITALLPTGSKMWLNGDPDDSEGYYPGLHAVCFYKELGRPSFTQGPKLWSMIFSVGILAVSYVYCGMLLISPSAGIPLENFRMRTGLKLRHFLDYMKRKTASPRILYAILWHIPYLLSYAIFISIRAFYDICLSMLLEILWLTFAMAWGTIRIWETRAAATWNFDGNNVTYNQKLSEENYWSFGQTLPLILLVLPLLSMAQTYLEEDAKEEDGMQPARNREEDAHRSASVSHAYGTAIHESTSSHGVHDYTRDQLVDLPIDALADISSCPWYHDHIALLLSQILMHSSQ